MKLRHRNLKEMWHGILLRIFFYASLKEDIFASALAFVYLCASMKETLKLYFKENLLFWAGMMLIILIMGLFLFENGQIETHFLLNSYHSPCMDVCMRVLTTLGSGLPCYVGIVVLIFWFRKGLFILVAQGFAALLTQPLKYAIARPRPLTLLGLENLPSVVDGYAIPGGYNSFPSGHVAAIFAFMACLAALLPKKYKVWQVAILVVAVAAAYSRIYLSCHFLEDTLVGAPIGAFSTAIAYMLLYYKEWGECPVYRLKIKHHDGCQR